LLDKGADLEAADEEKWRPLHFAAYQGRLSLARRLVDSGCELEPLSDEGKTPFYYALDGNHSEMIQFL
ncbi:ankyrin, partial [Cryphonectria parasitica EP155]